MAATKKKNRALQTRWDISLLASSVMEKYVFKECSIRDPSDHCMNQK
jgi:hypothetical protein